MLETSKDFIEKTIQNNESVINKGINEETKKIESDIEKHQKKRNRGIIKDIITTCADYRNTITNEFSTLRDEEDND